MNHLISSNFRSAILALAVFASAMTARATPYTVSGIDYDITMQSLTWNNPTQQAILTSTAWYGNQQLALDIAAVVQASLGVQTSWYNTGVGVYFVFNNVPAATVWTGSGVTSTNLNGVDYLPMKYAVGTVVPQVPDGGVTATMLGLSILGFVAIRRKLAI